MARLADLIGGRPAARRTPRRNAMGRRVSRTHRAAASLLLAALAAAGCDAPAFDARAHRAPRISVIHRPLRPDPGEPVRFIARAEPGAGATVTQVHVVAVLPGTGSVERRCSGAECELEVTAGGATGLSIYSASMRDSRGGAASSPSAYVFQVGRPGSEVFPLRVPFDLYRGNGAFGILLVRDRVTYPSDRRMLEDAESLIYDAVLQDPAYRWRDDQLAFHFTTFSGVTHDYHSGLASRCGQDPWIAEPFGGSARAAAAFADVVAVIHRGRTRDGRPFRDCAGLGVVSVGAGVQRHFSADGSRPEIFHHELGHALLGLSDEYREATETRRTRADDLGDGDPECRCCEEELGMICPPTVPPCDAPRPAECFPAPPACPPLGSVCPKPNVFPDRVSCEAAATAAAIDPGVELDAAPADCRLLCSGSDCPCLAAASDEQVWVLDRRVPTLPAAAPDDDLMGLFDEARPREWIGPACERCSEAMFCLAWEMGRGRSQAEAEGACLAP